MERVAEQNARHDAAASIETLAISNRARRRLLEAGIRTVDALLALNDEDLLRIPGFGHTCLTEIRSTLRVFRLSGNDSLVPPDDTDFPTDVPEALLDTRLQDLPISNRARAVFVRENFVTIRDYLALGEQQALRLRNFGAVTLANVNRTIRTACRTLKDEALLRPLLNVPRLGGPEAIDERFAAVPVASLDLPRRARRVCRELGIRTLRDLAALDTSALLVRRNFGQATLRRIQREVERFLDSVSEPQGDGFDALVNGLFVRLQDKERRLIELREGRKDDSPRTLGEVGQFLEITESRACQIEHTAWAKLRRFAAGLIDDFSRAVEETLKEHGGLAEPSTLMRHPAFAGSDASPTFVSRMLAKLLPHRLARLDDGRIAAIPGATLCSLTARLRKRLRRGGGSQDLREIVSDVTRGLDLGTEAPRLVQAVCENLFDREVVSDSTGSVRIRTPSQALGDDLIAVLETAHGPLHFTEIARRLCDPPFARAIDPEKVRLRLCRDDRFVLTGRGEYDLVERFTVPEPTKEKIVAAVTSRLEESGRPTSVAVLHQSLIGEPGLEDVSEFVVSIVLRNDAHFTQLGRGSFGLANANGSTSAVAHVSDLLVAILEEAGCPLSYAELRKRVQDRRRVSDGAISATLVGRDLFLRVARGCFDLASRHPITEEQRAALASSAKELVERRGGAASLEDLFDALRDDLPAASHAHATPILVGDILRRVGGFKFLSGGFVQIEDPNHDREIEDRAFQTLREAGEPLRPTTIARRLGFDAAGAARLKQILRNSPRFTAWKDGRYSPR